MWPWCGSCGPLQTMTQATTWHLVFTRARSKAGWTSCDVVPPGRSSGVTCLQWRPRSKYRNGSQSRGQSPGTGSGQAAEMQRQSPVRGQ
uniref:Secreted protein n=1 Tax=Engystomops pustulosus TaxID=76066 RepID=A0AAV6YJL4_ENGPU|nr:hypothetical protein GDO81_024697 [Engystomops pustulosus]